jgi:uncharacterized protein YkwD
MFKNISKLNFFSIKTIRNMRWFIFLLIFPFCTSTANLPKEDKQNDINSSDKACVSSDEEGLLEAINSYRKSKGLKAVPYSASMSIVAQQHAKELNNDIKELTHSWVDCKYTSGKRESYDCMWQKPKELTGYPDKGYECAFGKWGTKPYGPKDILQKWKESTSHNKIITNQGIWAKAEWKAMGVAINGNYAVLWFGKVDDPKGKPRLCK